LEKQNLIHTTDETRSQHAYLMEIYKLIYINAKMHSDLAD